jgi:hypothetical protein
MDVGESVVLVRDVEGVEEGTHGRVTDVTADRVVIECKVRERSAVVLTHTWEVLPERLWERLLRRRKDLR